MRFLAPAFYHKEFIKFGYVNLWSNDNVNLATKYNVNRFRETLLVFNEETESPVATLVVSSLVDLTFNSNITTLVLEMQQFINI